MVWQGLFICWRAWAAPLTRVGDCLCSGNILSFVSENVCPLGERVSVLWESTLKSKYLI